MASKKKTQEEPLQIQDWVRFWESKVPLALQEDWDHSGPQFGHFQYPLKGIVFSLDLTKSAIYTARESGANLIVTHHPVFFHPTQEILDQDPLQELILFCIEERIAVYSSHTPFDAVDGGVNDVLADRLGLSQAEPLRDRPKEDPLYAFSKGMGRIGQIPEMSLVWYAEQVAKYLDVPGLTYYGVPGQRIERVACLGGAGGDFYLDAIKKGADLLVTADLSYHLVQDAMRRGLALMDLGHDFSEKPAMARAMEWTAEAFPDLPLQKVESTDTITCCLVNPKFQW